MDIFKISKLKETITDFVKVKLELFKLDLTEHLSNILAQVIAYLVILIVSSIMLIFLSLALAHFVNSFVQNAAIGYLAVAGLYLLLLLIVLYLLKSGKLKSFFESKLIDTITNERTEKDE